MILRAGPIERIIMETTCYLWFVVKGVFMNCYQLLFSDELPTCVQNAAVFFASQLAGE